MAQVIDFAAARQAKKAQSAQLVIPVLKVAPTRRIASAQRALAVRMAAKEAL